MHFLVYLSLLFLYIGFPATKAQLRAVRLNTTLPGRLVSASAIYDGLDSIHIFGGGAYSTSPSNEILKFTISTEAIEVVSLLPRGLFGVTLSSDKDGHIHIHGGGYSGNTVSDTLKYFPSNQTVVNVDNLPVGKIFGGAVKETRDDSNEVLLIGGFGNERSVIVYNMDTAVSRMGPDLGANYEIATAISDDEGSAFVFGGDGFGSLTSVAVLNFSSLEVTMGPTTFPTFLYEPASVWDGTHAYIIGGFYSGGKGDSILKFDPKTMQHELLTVDNFPVNHLQMLFGTAAVYVEGLDRIYFFGGGNDQMNSFDGIWYIDLAQQRTS